MSSVSHWSRPPKDIKPPILKNDRRDNVAEVKGINIEVDINVDKLQHKLRAIAKHTEALADELDCIDNESINDLPTRFEGSE